MPLQSFRIFHDKNSKIDYDTTLKDWSRTFNYLFNKKLDSANIQSTALSLGTNQVKASNVDFGTGADEVDAADIPILDNSSYYVGATVEVALQEAGSTIRNLASSQVHVDDTGGYFTSSNVEDVLQEVGLFKSFSTTIGNPLSTTLGSSDLNVTNSLVNDIRQALVNFGILTT